MKEINGIILKPQDLKKEGNNYTFFRQLAQKNQPLSRNLDETFFQEFDSLLITPEDSLLGVKNDNQVELGIIKGAYMDAQQLFVSG